MAKSKLRQLVRLPWAAGSCPWVGKLRTVLPRGAWSHTILSQGTKGNLVPHFDSAQCLMGRGVPARSTALTPCHCRGVSTTVGTRTHPHTHHPASTTPQHHPHTHHPASTTPQHHPQTHHRGGWCCARAHELRVAEGSVSDWCRPVLKGRSSGWVGFTRTHYTALPWFRTCQRG
jgi:hypothetical protein